MTMSDYNYYDHYYDYYCDHYYDYYYDQVLIMIFFKPGSLCRMYSRCLYAFQIVRYICTNIVVMIFKMQKIHDLMSHPNLQLVQQQPVFPNLSFPPSGFSFLVTCNVEGG